MPFQIIPNLAKGALSLAGSGGGKLVVRSTQSLAPRVAQAARGVAFNHGRLSRYTVNSANAIAAGKNTSLVEYMIADTALDVAFEAADWMRDNVDDDDRDNAREMKDDILFGNLTKKHSPRNVEGVFSEQYPYALAMNPTHELHDTSDEKIEGKRKCGARLIGFWGVYVEIKEYDPSLLSSWKHSLDRRNFGTLALCKQDVPLMEASVHFSTQLILCQIVRMLTADSIYGEPSQHVTNTVHGYFSPGVKAEVSFLPVYECQHWEWEKSKPP